MINMNRRTFLKTLPFFGYCCLIANHLLAQDQLVASDTRSPILTRIATVNPNLARELSLLPEIADGISETDERGLENLIDFHDVDSAKFERVINSMLDIGLPKYRSYCSPLQAFFWLCSEEIQLEAVSVMQNYSLTRLLNNSWKDLRDGRNERWADFHTVVKRLNAPELVLFYGEKFLKTDTEYKYSKPTPEETFQSGRGIGWQKSALLIYCLEQAGYQHDGYLTYCIRFSISKGNARYGAVYRNLLNEWYYLGGSFGLKNKHFKQPQFKGKITEKGVGPYSSRNELVLNVLVPEDKKEWAGGAGTHEFWTSSELLRTQITGLY